MLAKTCEILCVCRASPATPLQLRRPVQCVPQKALTPSCAGRCAFAAASEPAGGAVQGAIAVPLAGGGYCFCDDGCKDEFTDNNSYGGCCGDHAWKCNGGKQDEECVRRATFESPLLCGHGFGIQLRPSLTSVAPHALSYFLSAFPGSSC